MTWLLAENIISQRANSIRNGLDDDGLGKRTLFCDQQVNGGTGEYTPSSALLRGLCCHRYALPQQADNNMGIA